MALQTPRRSKAYRIDNVGPSFFPSLRPLTHRTDQWATHSSQKAAFGDTFTLAVPIWLERQNTKADVMG